MLERLIWDKDVASAWGMEPKFIELMGALENGGLGQSVTAHASPAAMGRIKEEMRGTWQDMPNGPDTITFQPTHPNLLDGNGALLEPITLRGLMVLSPTIAKNGVLFLGAQGMAKVYSLLFIDVLFGDSSTDDIPHYANLMVALIHRQAGVPGKLPPWGLFYETKPIDGLAQIGFMVGHHRLIPASHEVARATLHDPEGEAGRQLTAGQGRSIAIPEGQRLADQLTFKHRRALHAVAEAFYEAKRSGRAGEGVDPILGKTQGFIMTAQEFKARCIGSKGEGLKPGGKAADDALKALRELSAMRFSQYFLVATNRRKGGKARAIVRAPLFTLTEVSFGEDGYDKEARKLGISDTRQQLLIFSLHPILWETNTVHIVEGLYPMLTRYYPLSRAPQKIDLLVNLITTRGESSSDGFTLKSSQVAERLDITGRSQDKAARIKEMLEDLCGMGLLISVLAVSGKEAAWRIHPNSGLLRSMRTHKEWGETAPDGVLFTWNQLPK